MRHIKCWVCNGWTSEDLIEYKDFEGSQAPVCVQCSEDMELRDRKLRAMRRVRNVTSTGSGTVAGQSAVGQNPSGPDDGATPGEGAVAERVGEGADGPGNPVVLTTQCSTEGCTALAMYTQLFLIPSAERRPASAMRRRCDAHKSKIDDVPPGWVLSAMRVMG